MKKYFLQNSDIAVPSIILGGNVFGWTVNEKDSFALLDEAIELGLNCVDTANSYSHWVPKNRGGESETIIGKWLHSRKNRDKVIIATKVGSDFAPNEGGLAKKYIFQAVEDSLRRLQTDYIDLYQSHYDDANTPIEETMEAFAELIKQGKVRAIGASNFTAERLEKTLQISQKNHLPQYISLQPLYNLYDRQPYETEFAPLVKREKLSVFPYYSLASGFLTGKYRSTDDFSKSARGQGISKYLNERGLSILRALDEVSATHQTSSQAQVALAWLMAQPSVTAPIASATNTKQLHQLADAAMLKLEDESLRKLTQASN